MVREKIRTIFGSKAFYIVFSLLASITLWLYVAYVENPDVTVNVSGIKVDFINKDFLNDKGLVITKTDTSTIALRFQGQRNTVSKLTSSNIKATADLSVIKAPGTYDLNYTISYPIDINQSMFTIAGRSSDTVTVTADALVKKDIQIKASYDGGVAAGYQAEPIELKPDSISVSGPKDIVSRIDHGKVAVLRENISKTVEDELPVKLFDSNGNEIPADNLVLSQKTVIVRIPVVMVKSVPLTVNLTPGAGADETNTVCTVTPPDISLSGDSETLNNLNQIVLGTIDLSQFLNSSKQTFKIVIPNKTTNLTGTTEAQVTVTVSGLDSKHVSVSNIQAANTAPGYTATIVTSTLDVTLRGKTDVLAKITPDNIRAVADLSRLNASTGTFTVLAKIYVDGDTKGAGAVGEYKVTVMLTQG